MENFWHNIEQLWHDQDEALRQQGRLMNSEQLQQLIEAEEAQRHSRRRSRMLTAAAACLLMLLGASFFFSLQAPSPSSLQPATAMNGSSSTLIAEDTLATTIQTIVKDTIKRLQKSVASVAAPTPASQLIAEASGMSEIEQVLRTQDSVAPASWRKPDTLKKTSLQMHGIRAFCNHQCNVPDIEQEANTLLAMI